MGFDMRAFLTELFHEEPALSVPARVPEALGADNGPAVATAREATATIPQPAPELLADWVLRPDLSGRLAWEAPDLPEAARWWADSTFDDLPEFPAPCPD